jgi:HD-like signal output (HDOD) protein/CheY-like chemotaxis protein
MSTMPAGALIRTLFVDDDAMVLDAMRRVFRTLRAEVHAEFARSGAEALTRLDAAPFDVIVADMRMPGMDGAQLLGQVMQRHPEVVRIILSGQADLAMIMRSISATHQYLCKPCDAETLRQTLRRAYIVRDLLADDTLKRVVSRLGTLPSPPALYYDVLEECRSPRSSVLKIADMIGQDIAMTARILHLVNSAFFARSRRISSPLQAVQLLGLDTVKALLLSAHVFSQFVPHPGSAFDIDHLQGHSVRASALARSLALLEHCEASVVDDTSVAALLHDIGQLILAASLPEQYDAIIRLADARAITLRAAEMETLGATHAAVGAYQLGLWNLPDAVVETVAFSHEPSRCTNQEFGALTLVHVADALGHEMHDHEMPGLAETIDTDYLQRVGCGARLPAWREVCAQHGAERAHE